MEEFRSIKDFEMYAVDRNGQVLNIKTNKILKAMTSTSGYAYYHLKKDGTKYTKYAHRLVGEAFLENPDNLPQIDHIDGNKMNNNVSNLRWVSVSENRMTYGCDTRAEKRKRQVIAQHNDGTELIFKSRQDAAIHFNCSPTKIKYNVRYVKGEKCGWIFFKAEDIV